MDIDITRKNSTATVNATLSADEMERHFRAAAKKASEGLSIKGFRPGNVPYETVAKSVGEDKLLKDVAERAAQGVLKQVVGEEGVEPIDTPTIAVKTIGHKEECALKITFPLLPEVTLPSLEGRTIHKKTPTVSDEEIDSALGELQRSRTKTVTVNRPVQEGDRVEITVTIRADGAIVEDGQSKNHPLVIGQDMYIPGFEKQLIGMEAGQEREFTLDVPEDYRDRRIAGRTIQCAVMMQLVQERSVPEINDAFAASMGQFETVDDLRQSVREGLLKEKKEKERQRMRATLIEEIADEATMEVPDVLIGRELAGMLADFEHTITRMGLSFDDYLKHLEKTNDELKQEWRPDAVKRVRIGLTLNAIADQKGIVPDEKEVEERINETVKQYGSLEQVEEQIDMERLAAYTRDLLQNEKVFEMLEERVEVVSEG